MGYTRSSWQASELLRKRTGRSENGVRYGKLVVIHDAGHVRVGKAQASVRLVKAKCDCGSTGLFKLPHLRTGATTSCGCAQKQCSRRIGIARRLLHGIAAFNALVRSYKSAARKRGHVVELEPADFTRLFRGNCAYCGCAPKAVNGGKNTHGAYVYNGIDRVDNEAGYTVENTVSCCSTCNLAKQTMTRAEFLSWVKRVYEHSVCH